jgi:hypothetical protein
LLVQDDNYGRSVQTVNNENRIKHMKKELEDLKKKVPPFLPPSFPLLSVI